ncbi:hypothetical protein WL95_07840 [Burkholderia cepacia]|nr:hypothetical protein WL95_07840 [Burkholderia cepacia]
MGNAVDLRQARAGAVRTVRAATVPTTCMRAALRRYRAGAGAGPRQAVRVRTVNALDTHQAGMGDSRLQ